MKATSIYSPSLVVAPLRRWQDKDATLIELDAPKIRFVLVAGSLWLVGWCFGLYGAVAALGFGHRGYALLDTFLLAWLALWLLSGLVVLSILLWGYFGRERLTITPETFTLERLVFGRGRKQTFAREEVGNFRFREVRTDFFGARSKWSMLGLGGGKVRFDYRGRGYSFGLGLEDEEAKSLADELDQLV